MSAMSNRSGLYSVGALTRACRRGCDRGRVHLWRGRRLWPSGRLERRKAGCCRPDLATSPAAPRRRPD
jgi:hypothetical protein